MEAAERAGRLLGSFLVWEYSSSLSTGAQCPLPILYTDQEKKKNAEKKKPEVSERYLFNRGLFPHLTNEKMYVFILE